jgi:hypothetical protein
MSQDRKPLFSAAERAHIATLVVGEPSGVTVEIGGMEVNLLPLSNRQGKQALRLIGVVAGLTEGDTNAQIGITVIAKLIASEGESVRALVHDILLTSSKASGLIDVADDGEAVFEEWYDSLSLVETIKTMLPAIVKANGLDTMLGNPLTADAEPIAPAAENQPSLI